DVGAHQRHRAGAALVLAEGGDPVRAGRPRHHRLVGVFPAGVVGGVAVIGAAVEGELYLVAAVDVTHPQVPVADEGLAPPVGGTHAGLLRRLRLLAVVAAPANAAGMAFAAVLHGESVAIRIRLE